MVRFDIILKLAKELYNKGLHEDDVLHALQYEFGIINNVSIFKAMDIIEGGN